MTVPTSLQVVEQDLDEQAAEFSADDPDVPEMLGTSMYEDAEPFDELPVEARRLEEFVDALLSEIPIEASIADARLVDVLRESDDVDFGMLLVWSSEDLLLIGSDPTAKDALPLFGFHVGAADPVPAPSDVEDALGLLKPAAVEDALHEDDYLPDRQGEWWLLPTPQVPVSETFQPGVARRPYGPSPLGNHVPPEFAFTVFGSEFVERFHDHVDGAAPSSLSSPMEVLEWIHRQHNRRPTPDYAPDWEEVRSLAGTILVRGTVRHREDDHFVENVGDAWHEAQTHSMDVWTADAVNVRPRID